MLNIWSRRSSCRKEFWFLVPERLFLPLQFLLCNNFIKKPKPNWFLVLLPDIFCVLELRVVTKVSQLISGRVACFRELLPGTLLTLRDMSGTSLEESACFGALSPSQTHLFLLFQTNFSLGQQAEASAWGLVRVSPCLLSLLIFLIKKPVELSDLFFEALFRAL